MYLRAKRVKITPDDVIKELAVIGFARIDDFATVNEFEVTNNAGGKSKKKVFTKGVEIKTTAQTDVSKIPAIASIKQGANGIEIKLHDKVKALELIGKHLGIFEKDNDQKKPPPSTTSEDVLNKIAAKLNA